MTPDFGSLSRRAFVGLALLVVIVATTVGWSMPDPKPNRHQTAVDPAPIRIEWDEHQVGGMLLCHAPDSTGTTKCIKLPPGTIVLVPRRVEGAPPTPKGAS